MLTFFVFLVVVFLDVVVFFGFVADLVSFFSTFFSSFILFEEALSPFMILVSIMPVVIIIFLDVFFDKSERKFIKTF